MNLVKPNFSRSREETYLAKASFGFATPRKDSFDVDLVLCQTYLFGYTHKQTFTLQVLMAASTQKVRLDQTLVTRGKFDRLVALIVGLTVLFSLPSDL
jgi:hypothetical protein